MRKINEVVELLRDLLDRESLDEFIVRKWVQPVKVKKHYYFEEIDVARIRLICELRHDMQVNDESVDIVLSLLDQVYGLREQMRQLTASIERQPRNVQADIFSILTEIRKDNTD